MRFDMADDEYEEADRPGDGRGRVSQDGAAERQGQEELGA
jgi:hypothetical protein